MLAHSFLIESSSKLLVTRTGIKEFDFGPLVSMAHLFVVVVFFSMRFDLGTLDSGERSLPFGLLVLIVCRCIPVSFTWHAIDCYISSLFVEVKNVGKKIF